MIIIPLGHEAMTARRWPWVTTWLIVANLTVFVAFAHFDRKNDQLLAERGLTALAYYQQHSYLTLKSPLDEFIDGARPREASRTESASKVEDLALVHANLSSAESNLTTQVLLVQQAELDSRVSAFAEAAGRWRSSSFGYVPRGGTAWSLISYQFIHGGWLHLLGNLWFLWLAGCNLEDTWGRRLFVVFYLTSGIAAAFAHKMLAWNSYVPLIGASGAVAGLLGAFAWRQARTKVRLFVFVLIRWRIWHIPAYFLLAAWFIVEMAQGILSSRQSVTVAHFAHVGGFAFGFFVAWLLRKSGLEKHMDQKLEGLFTRTQDPQLGMVDQWAAEGELQRALVVLDRMAIEQAGNIDVQLSLLRVATQAGNSELARRARLQLIELYLRHDMGSTALELYDELGTQQMRMAVPANLRLRIARQYEHRANYERAIIEYEAIEHDDEARALVVSALLGQAEMACRLGRRASALEILERAERGINHQPELEHVVRQRLVSARNELAESRAVEAVGLVGCS